ncbi:Alpha/beta fold hydrolase [Acanthopleuribacter pedis]
MDMVEEPDVLNWWRRPEVTQLESVDLTSIGAASGGFLSFSGEPFRALVDSGMRLRVIDRGRGFGGELARYHIFGNTPCRDYLCELDLDLQKALREDATGRLFSENEARAPRLSAAGHLLEALGRLMVRDLSASLPYFQHLEGCEVVAVQDRGLRPYRVFGLDHREGQTRPFWFESDQLYLGLGAVPHTPSLLNGLAGDPRLFQSMDAMSQAGMQRLQSRRAAVPEPEVHLVGTNHAAAALLTWFYLEPLLAEAVVVPGDLYWAEVDDLLDLLQKRDLSTLPKLCLWYRGHPASKRIAIRAADQQAVLALADQMQYAGPIYESIFGGDGPDNPIIYNSHNALERPHAVLMQAAAAGRLPGTRCLPLPDLGEDAMRAEFERATADAAAVVNCTGIRPKTLSFYDPHGNLLPPFAWPQTSRHPCFKQDRGPSRPCLQGVYLNGVLGAQPVRQKVKRHVRGGLDDLKKAYAIGVRQSRLQGSEDLALILEQHQTVILHGRHTTPHAVIHYRHNRWRSGRPTLLFLHGLGESGLCFEEAFSCAALTQSFNILVPDLPGFGKSALPHRGDCSLDAMWVYLTALLKELACESVFLVGHSMGGDLGTLACSVSEIPILGFVNIDGSLTLADRFISLRCDAAFRDDRLPEWRDSDLIAGCFPEWIKQDPACAPALTRYATSIRQADPRALGGAAASILAHNRAGWTLGEQYLALATKRVFFSGANQRSRETAAFLEEQGAGLAVETFSSGHWVMVQAAEACYQKMAHHLAAWL